MYNCASERVRGYNSTEETLRVHSQGTVWSTLYELWSASTDSTRSKTSFNIIDDFGRWIRLLASKYMQSDAELAVLL